MAYLSHFLILSTISFDFLRQVKTCTELSNLKQDLMRQPANHPDITFFDVILYQKTRMIFSSYLSLKSALLEKLQLTYQKTCWHIQELQPPKC